VSSKYVRSYCIENIVKLLCYELIFPHTCMYCLHQVASYDVDN